MSTARKFRLSDAIALVAATAIGLALVKPYYEHPEMDPLRWAQRFGLAMPFNIRLRFLCDCLVIGSPFVVVWTLAIFGLRLVMPRPRWRRLVRQPGLVAGMMAALALVWRLLGFATLCIRVWGDAGLAAWSPRHFEGIGCFIGPTPGWFLFDTDNFLNTAAMIGVAVASSWSLMLISKQWRPERSWIDWAGRLLGWFWIVILPLTGWWDFHTRF